MTKGYYKTSAEFTRKTPIPSSHLPRRENYEHSTQFSSSLVSSMKWETVKGVPLGDPEVWGPSFWFTLHNGAAHYPRRASPLFAERMKGFIMGIPVMVPCEKCADHATAHIEANWHRLDEIVSGREELFKFFWEFHNKVNRRYNKPEMSLEDAWKLYTGRMEVQKMKYN